MRCLECRTFLLCGDVCDDCTEKRILMILEKMRKSNDEFKIVRCEHFFGVIEMYISNVEKKYCISLYGDLARFKTVIEDGFKEHIETITKQGLEWFRDQATKIINITVKEKLAEQMIVIFFSEVKIFCSNIFHTNFIVDFLEDLDNAR